MNFLLKEIQTMLSHYLDNTLREAMQMRLYIPFGAVLVTLTCFFSSFSTALALPLTPFGFSDFFGGIMKIDRIFLKNILDINKQ